MNMNARRILCTTSLAALTALAAGAARAEPFMYVTNEGDASVSVIDTATGAVVGPPIVVDVDFTSDTSAIAVSPDGTRAYVLYDSVNSPGGDGSYIAVIDTAAHSVIQRFAPLEKIGLTGEGRTPGGGDIVVSPDGTRVLAFIGGYIVGVDTDIFPFDPTENEFPFDVNEQRPLDTYARAVWSPDGTRVYATDYGTDSIVVVNPAWVTGTAAGAGNAVVEEFPIGATNPFGIAVTRDGKWLHVTDVGDIDIFILSTRPTLSLVESSPNPPQSDYRLDDIALLRDRYMIIYRYLPEDPDENLEVVGCLKPTAVAQETCNGVSTSIKIGRAHV